LEVVDFSGKTPSTVNYQPSTNSVNVSTLSQGIYFLKVETDKGTVIQKFIKE